MTTPRRVRSNNNGNGRENQHVPTQKRILLVSPDGGTVAYRWDVLLPPLGVTRLEGYLNANGHQTEHFDPNLWASSRKGPTLAEKFGEQQWDFIGFSVLDETLLQDIQNMYTAKKLCPRAMIIAGGIEAQFNYQTLLDKSPCRLVILGEGETPLLMLANEEPWEKIPGIVVKNMAVAMSQELFNEATQLIPWETLRYEDYWNVYSDIYETTAADSLEINEEMEATGIKTVRVFSRNRCPIGCKYCSSTPQLTQATGLKVPVISTTEENLIDVIKRIAKAHPDVRMVYLTDDDFVINKLSVIKFCKLAIEANFGDLRFMCFARISDLTEEVVEWMAKANFYKLNIGLESFSQTVLDEVGKRVDASRIHDTLKMLKKHGVLPYCNIILSTPQSTLEDVELTLDEVLGYMDDDFYSFGIVPAIYPLKGTEFYKMYWDFKSHVLPIPGTSHTLRRDDFIYSEDPLMREFQIRCIEGSDAVVEQYVRESGRPHANAGHVARTKCLFAKRLIAESREEAASGMEQWNETSTPGAARFYTEVRTKQVNPLQATASDKSGL